MADEAIHETAPSGEAASAPSDDAPVNPGASERRPSLRQNGVARVTALATLMTLVIVFGVLDVTHVLFPQKSPDSTRPLVINAHIIGGPTATTAPLSPLHVSPQQLTMACHSSSTLVLTSSGSQPVSWSVDNVGQDLLLGQNQPQAGTLSTGQSVRINLTALGAATDTSLTFTDDQSNLVTVSVSVHCP